MGNELMCARPAAFFLVPDRFKTQEICIKAAEADPWQLHSVLDDFKTQEMCDRVVRHDPLSLQFVPDWFVTQQRVKLRHDDNDHCNNEGLINWYNGCKKRKAQKAKIKDELMPIAWHLSRWWDWCVPEDEKKDKGYS